MNQRPNPLEIPEILSRVGLYIPLWVHSSEYSSRPRSWRPRFAPQHLLNCILVNKTWHDILLPILWFSLDDISVPSLLHAFNALSRHSRHLRILELSRLALGTISLPLSLLPHNLLHLNLNGLGNNQWARALVLQNTRLQSLRWQGGDFHRDNYYETLDALALSKRLHRLQDLCLECWKLDGSFMKLLRKNPSLKRISLDYVSGEVQDKFTPWDTTRRNQGGTLKGSEGEKEEEKNDDDDDDDNEDEETEVILPDLVSLTVCKDVESGALEALIRLCPGLEELSWMGPNDGDLRQLTTNIRECCPSLSALTYSTVDISEDESLYAELIRSVPHLVELQIKIPALGDAFTEALIKHAPTLEILELTISGNHVNCNANFKRILTSCHQITALSIEGSKCGAASLFSFNWACLRLNRLLLVGLQSIAQDPPYNTDSESIAAMYGWTVATGGDGTVVSPIQHEIFDQAEGEGIDGVTTTEEIRQYAEGQDAAPQICTRFLRRLLTHLQTMRHLQSFFLNGVEYTRTLTDCSEPIYI
ncbi:hypothetical protein BGZ79_003263 [Entomortierella chlamydospora]|nr:hypothetical protein BGZ79_003263 [Entomortierella chlamydospora]